MHQVIRTDRHFRCSQSGWETTSARSVCAYLSQSTVEL